MTEVGWSSGSEAERIAFMADFVPWAEQSPAVAALAMFGAVRSRSGLFVLSADAGGSSQPMGSRRCWTATS
jgi:hypothetical protein